MNTKLPKCFSVFCRTEAQSRFVVSFLKEQGYNNMFYLIGTSKEIYYGIDIKNHINWTTKPWGDVYTFKDFILLLSKIKAITVITVLPFEFSVYCIDGIEAKNTVKKLNEMGYLNTLDFVGGGSKVFYGVEEYNKPQQIYRVMRSSGTSWGVNFTYKEFIELNTEPVIKRYYKTT